MEEIYDYLEMVGPVNWLTCFVGIIIYMLLNIKQIQMKLAADPNRDNFRWKVYFENNWADYALSLFCSFGGMLIAHGLTDGMLIPAYSGAIGTCGTWLWMTAINIYRNYVAVKAGGQAVPPNATDNGQPGQ